MILDLQPLIDKTEKEIFELKKQCKLFTNKMNIIFEELNDNSKHYINNIEKKCDKFGVKSRYYRISDYDSFPYHALKTVNVLPIRPFSNINKQIISENLKNYGDVDNFTGKSHFKHCTVEAVREIIEYYELQNKSICIIGSNLGEEISKELKSINCVPIVINTRTNQELNKKYMMESDVLISCTGKKNLLTSENTRGDQIVLNVGLTDVSKELYNKYGYKITPKKNGIGELTTLILFKHMFQ